MKEPYYTIKEASARVGVESHVLRYWEEELKMDIHRNQMGHRYYTEHDIELLTMVRKLKDKGLQLKAIRSYIEKRQDQLEGKMDEGAESNNELVPMNTGTGIMSNTEKLEQFQRIMNRILSNAIQENNELIGRTAGEHAANAVVTHFEGMTKEQEERAEERYRKLDQTLREIQLARREAAAANMSPLDKRKSKRLKRKNKQQANNMTSKEEIAADEYEDKEDRLKDSSMEEANTNEENIEDKSSSETVSEKKNDKNQENIES